MDSLLLRIYNEAAVEREARKHKKIKPPQSPTPEQAVDEKHSLDGPNDGSNDNQEPALSFSSAVLFVQEIEELIKQEQRNRVAILQQVTAEREQVSTLRVEPIQLSTA